MQKGWTGAILLPSRKSQRSVAFIVDRGARRWLIGVIEPENLLVLREQAKGKELKWEKVVEKLSVSHSWSFFPLILPFLVGCARTLTT